MEFLQEKKIARVQSLEIYEDRLEKETENV